MPAPAATSLAGSYGQKHREYEAGIGRLVQRGPGASALPQPVQQYVDTVRAFDAARSTGAPAGEALRQYPGSPAIAHAFKRAQDQSGSSSCTPPSTRSSPVSSAAKAAAKCAWPTATRR
ncbi:MAG: 23S rRNA (adenine(2030)-N(6))-methyltransferase RlmJ [Rubrivivax sp.]